ncbi:hypothetical protein EU527_05625 [Candidatus Thorarchaeota archaeon]|nr:MAG: hypothetical protein EU527_05625 [Candidatus Thorarchaeota archaeon]
MIFPEFIGGQYDDRTMQIIKEEPIRDFILIHIIFGLVAAIVLLIPFGGVISGKVLILVLTYNGLVIVYFHTKGYKDWQTIWIFSFILSLLMIVPDWYLARTLGALYFPDDGFPMIGGSIPIYMAGLWAIPFFIILFIGNEVQKRRSLQSAYGAVIILSTVIFTLAELTLVYLPSWTATVSGMTGNLAWYIIIPELLLGLSLFICYNYIKERQYWMKIVGAVTVMIFYIGNASFFYFLIETLLLGS